jgi:hypothetical protein
MHPRTGVLVLAILLASGCNDNKDIDSSDTDPSDTASSQTDSCDLSAPFTSLEVEFTVDKHSEQTVYCEAILLDAENAVEFTTITLVPGKTGTATACVNHNPPTGTAVATIHRTNDANDDITVVDEREVLTLEPWVTNRFRCDVWAKGGFVAFDKCKDVKE